MQHLLEYVLLGLSSGGAYALIALSLVAVYRGTGVVNFAQAAIGMASTYVFWKLHAHTGLALWPAILVGLATGSAISLAFYAFIGRRLVGASATTKTLVTLGLLLMLQAIVRIAYTNQQEFVPSFLVSGGTIIFGTHVQYLALLLVAVAAILTLLLTLLFERTRFGHVTTALQDSPMGAQALGFSPHPWGATAWGLSGALAALAGILLSPITALSPDALSSLVIPALGAALIAGFRRFWLALIIGVAAGIAQSVAIGAGVESGLARSIPYIVTLIALVVSGRNLPGRGTVDAPRLFRVGSGRISPLGLAIGGVIVVVAIYALPDYWSDTLALTAIFATLGLSVVIAAGYAGQVSLLPLGVTGGSVLLAAVLSQKGAPLLLTLAGTTALGAVVGLVIGFSTARLRGLGITIATLALAAIIETWVFTDDFFINGVQGWTIGGMSIAGLSFDNALHPQRFALLTWIVTILAALSLAALRGSRAGRRILATRSNERAAAASGISVPQAKMAAFAISTAFAALAGALLALQSGTVGGQRFGEGFAYTDSLTVLSMTVLSGAGFIMGGILTGIFAPGGALQQLLSFGGSFNDWLALLLSLNMVFVLISEPDGVVAQVQRGIARLPERLRHHFRRRSRRLPTADLERLRYQPTDARAVDGPALAVTDLTVSYGDTVVVDRVSFTLEAGTVLGILGANGAGKSSLVDAITGFVPVRGGEVFVQGKRVTGLQPHQRVAQGLTRTFQDHLLFEDLSVAENLETAAERQDALAYLLAPFGLARRRTDPAVLAAAEVAGVGHLLDTLVETLSLGWHARVTLARALAARPAVLCLDEPAAALSPEARQNAVSVIQRAARELGIAVLLIEHNIDVILQTCDAAIVMESGRIIAHGRPSDVLRRPEVLRSYLGEPLNADEAQALAEIEA